MSKTKKAEAIEGGFRAQAKTAIATYERKGMLVDMMFWAATVKEYEAERREMLAALKKCEDWLVSVGADGAPLPAVRAAIAKAEAAP